MTALVLLFVVLTLASLLASTLSRGSEARRKERLAEKLRRADDRVGRDARAARHAMNEAAAQSWRNRFE